MTAPGSTSSAADAPAAASQQIFAPGVFDDTVALVTGGGSGIGLATSAEFLRLGARVVICGRNPDRLRAASEQLCAAAAADRVLAMPCDIREPEAIDVLLTAALERFERIDVLVNNAGGQFPAPAEAISANGFAAVVRNNLCGTFNITVETAKRSMIPRKHGRIVNVIANIYRGFPGMVHTGAARAGVENMTMTLAVEWARHRIGVNAVAPGIILSSGTEQYPKQILDYAVRGCPMGRAGTVHEVAASIVFLASPAAQFITGATLRIDGAHSLAGDVFPST